MATAAGRTRFTSGAKGKRRKGGGRKQESHVCGDGAARDSKALSAPQHTRGVTIPCASGNLVAPTQTSRLYSRAVPETRWTFGGDEGLIEKYVRVRSKEVKPATVNHHLATLRRALRLAQERRI